MSRRVRDTAIGLALTLVAAAGALWQVEQSAGASGPGDRAGLPRLICPLHLR